jgi:hypothetical protein
VIVMDVTTVTYTGLSSLCGPHTCGIEQIGGTFTHEMTCSQMHTETAKLADV